MGSLYYKKRNTQKIRKIVRISGLAMALCGFIFLLYFCFPLISMQLYLSQAYASAGLTTPIPQTTVLTKSAMQSLLATATDALRGVDYTNALNWYPNFRPEAQKPQQITSYFISIPELRITNAVVSTVDYDLASHLINYGGTGIPPENGNAVIFGHSTLPQLYNPNDYKTIFANIHELEVGDEFIVKVKDISYRYKIFSITIIDPDDPSPLAQEYDDSYLTIITCTPPGTTWKRLVLKARLEKI